MQRNFVMLLERYQVTTNNKSNSIQTLTIKFLQKIATIRCDLDWIERPMSRKRMGAMCMANAENPQTGMYSIPV